ncbi:MAG: hypothetical protein AAGH72_13025 [Verrucomicrobiota bacterium]
MNSTSTTPSTRGYILLEMLLALAIFVIALAPLGRVINELLDAYVTIRQQDQLQTALINQTQLFISRPLKEGTTTVKDDRTGITTETRVEPYESDATDEIQIRRVFEVTITVSSFDGELSSNFYFRNLNP